MSVDGGGSGGNGNHAAAADGGLAGHGGKGAPGNAVDGGRADASQHADASPAFDAAPGNKSDAHSADSADAASARDGAIGSDSGSMVPPPPPDDSFAMHPANGPVTLMTDADMRAFCSRYDGVDGSLTIDSSTITTLDALQCLVEVTGTLEISATALTSAALPKLRAVGSLELGYAAGLATIDLPVFEFVRRGEVRIFGSDALLALALPNLTYVATNLAITANTKLTDLSAPKLTHVGSDVSLSNSQLVHADFDALIEIGHDFSISSTAFGQIELRALRTVGNNFVIPPGTSYVNVDLSHLISVGSQLGLDGNDIDVHKDDDLVVLDLSSLVFAQTVTIEEHPQLKEIRAPKLTSALAIFVVFDPVLERVDFSALVSSSVSVACSTDPKLMTADFSALATAKLLDFTTGGPADITLPSLTTADQGIQTSGLRSFDAPLLTSCGSATFAGAADGFRVNLPHLTQVSGPLDLGAGLNDLTLPLLESVETLVIQDVALSQLEFAALNQATTISVGQSMTFASLHVPMVVKLDQLELTGPALHDCSFDALSTVNKMSVTHAPLLQTLSFPALTQVVTLDLDTTGLTDLSLGPATDVGELDVRSNPNLKSVTLPSADVFTLYVTDNAVLATLDLPSMTRPSTFSMSNNGKITSLSGFGGLTTVINFLLVDHPELVDLQGLHGITTVYGNFQITGNTKLSQSEVDALVAAIGRQNIAGTFMVQ